MRIFALSDIHVDYAENMEWIRGLSSSDYARDTLVLAGDVSHDLEKLDSALAALAAKFDQVFFVPGNHDLWLIQTSCRDSVEKFRRILERCSAAGVWTGPAKVRTGSGEAWIVPLFSWYALPEEGEESLFLPKRGEDPDLDIWSDFHFVRWPDFPPGIVPATYFLRLNEPALTRSYDAPVVTFSHFLPRSDLMLNTPEEGPVADPNPSFNFSRVAGAKGLEAQIRKLGSVVHVYGHQHRNRDRTVDGVRYVSYCLGYRHEREAGHLRGHAPEPKLIWE